MILPKYSSNNFARIKVYDNAEIILFRSSFDRGKGIS